MSAIYPARKTPGSDGETSPLHVEPLVLFPNLCTAQKHPVEGARRVGFGLDQQASRVAARRESFSLIFTKMPHRQW